MNGSFLRHSKSPTRSCLSPSIDAYGRLPAEHQRAAPVSVQRAVLWVHTKRCDAIQPSASASAPKRSPKSGADSSIVALAAAPAATRRPQAKGRRMSSERAASGPVIAKESTA